MKRVITIDGPSGAGKSTVAKILSERLGFQYLDTGALYRVVAIHLRRQGINEDTNDEKISQYLSGLDILLTNEKVFLKGCDVSDIIRDPEIGHFSSVFSARIPVREYLLDMQRAYSEQHDIVAEGRDMGTVVFTNAWKKFFIDASLEERARRRFLQLKEKSKEITIEVALRDVRDRDIRDSTRCIAPLKKAADAIYIDTTSISIEEAVKRILEFL